MRQRSPGLPQSVRSCSPCSWGWRGRAGGRATRALAGLAAAGAASEGVSVAEASAGEAADSAVEAAGSGAAAPPEAGKRREYLASHPPRRDHPLEHAPPLFSVDA